MNVLQISANTESLNMPTLPMGLGLVAAATEKAGHRVRFLDLIAEHDQVSAEPRFLLEVARPVMAQCKALSQAPVILGGAGYSMFPESARAFLGADMGIQGEGEAAFVALLETLDANGHPSEVPDLYLRGNGPRETCKTALESLALPRSSTSKP